MDRTKFSTLAHVDHVFCNPLGSAKVDQVLGLLELSPGDLVLDAGCGKAEMLVRLIERFGVRAVGVDRNPQFLEEARARAAQRVPDGHLVLREMDGAAFSAGAELFRAGLCVGSTHVYGGYRETLRALSGMVRSGGYLVVGEGYWKREPDPDYLAILGAAPTDYVDHAGNVAAGVEEDLVPLYSSVSSEDDWDHYEGLYCRAIERYVRAHPDDPDRAEMLDRIHRWRDAYLRWGRRTLGFALYLFQRP